MGGFLSSESARNLGLLIDAPSRNNTARGRRATDEYPSVKQKSRWTFSKTGKAELTVGSGIVRRNGDVDEWTEAPISIPNGTGRRYIYLDLCDGLHDARMFPETPMIAGNLKCSNIGAYPVDYEYTGGKMYVLGHVDMTDDVLDSFEQYHFSDMDDQRVVPDHHNVVEVSTLEFETVTKNLQAMNAMAHTLADGTSWAAQEYLAPIGFFGLKKDGTFNGTANWYGIDAQCSGGQKSIDLQGNKLQINEMNSDALASADAVSELCVRTGKAGIVHWINPDGLDDYFYEQYGLGIQGIIDAIHGWTNHHYHDDHDFRYDDHNGLATGGTAGPIANYLEITSAAARNCMSGTIGNAGGTLVIDPPNMQLHSSNIGKTFDWNACVAYSGVERIDWTNGYLYEGTPIKIALKWFLRQAIGSNGSDIIANWDKATFNAVTGFSVGTVGAEIAGATITNSPFMLTQTNGDVQALYLRGGILSLT